MGGDFWVGEGALAAEGGGFFGVWDAKLNIFHCRNRSIGRLKAQNFRLRRAGTGAAKDPN